MFALLLLLALVVFPSSCAGGRNYQVTFFESLTGEEAAERLAIALCSRSLDCEGTVEGRERLELMAGCVTAACEGTLRCAELGWYVQAIGELEACEAELLEAECQEGRPVPETEWCELAIAPPCILWEPPEGVSAEEQPGCEGYPENPTFPGAR